MMSPTMAAWKALIGRICLAVIFIIVGVMKITSFAAMVAYSTSVGLPFPEIAVALSIVVEVVGGLMLVFGFKTRLAAKALLVFVILATAFFHLNLADQTQMTMFLKNLAIAGGLLILIAHGAGAYSLDAKKAAPTPTV